MAVCIYTTTGNGRKDWRVAAPQQGPVIKGYGFGLDSFGSVCGVYDASTFELEGAFDNLETVAAHFSSMPNIWRREGRASGSEQPTARRGEGERFV
jgi:hypothetical protein